jgi:bacillithiol biosynthesis cysteine-adding enzyme BshC
MIASILNFLQKYLNQNKMWVANAKTSLNLYMPIQSIKRSEVAAFSEFSVAFSDQEQFASVLNRPFVSLESLTAQAREKKQAYSSKHREVLVHELELQLAQKLSESQRKNLDLLRLEDTFTITTGHQLTLFGGPMYLVYKVLHVVKLTEMWNKSQSEFKAVPVFWMASEDHDLDEVRSTHLFGKKFIWETDQTGAVGRMKTTGLTEVLESFKELFAGKDAEIEALLKLESAYYAGFNQAFLSSLFAEFGVLVIQPDSAALKELFLPVMKREMEENCSFPAVSKMNAVLAKMGWEPQAQARVINLFHLSEGKRSRIEKSGDSFKMNDAHWSAEELLKTVHNHPEQFSPNVILRPVYQETILPNLAYIGGGGEMAYWVQLKYVFAAHETVYPLIQQRNSLHVIDAGMQKRMEKLDFAVQDYFLAVDTLKKRFISENSAEEVDMTYVYDAFEQFKKSLIEKTSSVAQALENMAEAESVKMFKQLEQIESKLVKHVKQGHEQALKSIEFICERFLPENTLQERYFHWLHFAPDGNYSKLFQRIYAVLDPMNEELLFLWPEEFTNEH